MIYACVEGPCLGTQAESHFLRQAGCHLVGMTNVPEAILAREAQMAYVTVGLVTDYDCWLDDPTQHVSVFKLPKLALAADASGEMPLDSIGKPKGSDGRLEMAYDLNGTIASDTRIVLGGKDIPISPDGRFSIPLKICEGENDYWIQIISGDGYGRFAKISASLYKKGTSESISHPVKIQALSQ